MKLNKYKKLLICIILLLTVTCNVQAEEKEERVNVFRDISFGDNIEYLEDELGYELERLEHKEDVLHEPYYGIKIYRRKNEDYNLGSVKFDTIEYLLFDDKVIFIELRTSDIEQLREIFEMLKFKYGDPTGKTVNDYFQHYYFNSEKYKSAEVIVENGNLLLNLMDMYTYYTDVGEYQYYEIKKKAEENANSW